MNGNVARINGKRYKLTEIPSVLMARVGEDTDPDWSWVSDHDSFTGDWGQYGPIDVDGNEYIALVILVERHWEDGESEVVDACGGVTVQDDATLPGIGEAPIGIDVLRLWHAKGDNSAREHIAQTALEMMEAF